MSVLPQHHAITDALGQLRDGVPGAFDRLVPLVYGDLAGIAHRQLALEESGHTLSTTELVHEAYLRLVDQTHIEWNDRVHFFAVAAHVMRRVLVDHARRHRDAKTGQLVPAHFIQEVKATVNGTPVLAADMGSGVSKNPYLGFKVKGAKAGDKVVVNWVDNKGDTNSAEAVIG